MPQVCYISKRTGKNVSLPIKTYAEVKNSMRYYLDLATAEVKVFRSRRGKWGEWIEDWSLVDDKLVKRDIGWN